MADSHEASENVFSPSIEQLKDVLRASVQVAKAGTEQTPPVEEPARLKKVINFAKLTDTALSQVREVLETDEVFRSRVVDNVDLKNLSTISKLWLTRPEGWQQQCHEMLASEAQQVQEAAFAQNQAAQNQQLAQLKTAIRRAERQRDKALEDRDAARTQATQARSEARQISEQTAKLEKELQTAIQDQQELQKSLDRYQRIAERTEEKLKKSQDEVKLLNKELRDTQSAHVAETNRLVKQLEDVELQLTQAKEAGFVAASEPEPTEADLFVPLQEPTKRSEVKLPPGILNDTVQGLEYLLRVPNLVMLVDGYNVTYKSKEWQQLPPAEQRIRFLQKLDEVSARYSEVEIVVWFDGQATDYDYISTTTRSLGLKVCFSPAGVEADDEILKSCGKYPFLRPVAVVSHDGRVRQGAREQGANLVQPSKLLALMGLEAVNQGDAPGF